MESQTYNTMTAPAAQPGATKTGLWKIVSIVALVAVLGLAAALVVYVVKSEKKVADLERQVETATAGGDEVTSPSPELAEIDFSVFAEKMPEGAIVELDGSKMGPSSNGKYEIAQYNAYSVDEEYNVTSGWMQLFYRALPDGEWETSSFSGQGAPDCADVTEEEKEAFEGEYECENYIE